MIFKYLGILAVSAGLCAPAFAGIYDRGHCPPNHRIQTYPMRIYNSKFKINLSTLQFKSAKVVNGKLECHYASEEGAITATKNVVSNNCGFKSTGSTLSKDCKGAKPAECEVYCEST